MTPPNITYSAGLLLAGLFCLLVGYMVQQRKPYVPGSVPLIVFLFALSWWDITYSIFWAGLPGPTPFFWLDITYLGAVTVPTAFLAFALQLAGLGEWLRRSLLAILFIEPLLVVLLLFTDPWHTLFFAGKRFDNSGMIIDAGPVFWANVAYSYLLLLAGLVLLVRKFFQSSGIYRRQLAVILAGVSLTWLNSIIFLVGLNPLPGADNTPFSFTLAALAFAFALVRYRLFELTPIARDALVEGMSDGVVVLDAQNRLVDLNPRAASLLAPGIPAPMGKSADQLFANWSGIPQALQDTRGSQIEITLEYDQLWLDVQVTPLHDRHGNFMGRLMVWRDISRLKQIQVELEELATHDPLTGLFNRRHFYQLAEQAMERSAANDQPLTLVMLDIDFFKQINDTFGHHAGDEALRMVARLCRASLRQEDIVARLGGEEFALMLDDTTLDQAVQLADRLRLTISANHFSVEGQQSACITASLGAATWQPPAETLDNLMRRADQALYASKRAGRDQVTAWHTGLPPTASFD